MEVSKIITAPFKAAWQFARGVRNSGQLLRSRLVRNSLARADKAELHSGQVKLIKPELVSQSKLNEIIAAQPEADEILIENIKLTSPNLNHLEIANPEATVYFENCNFVGVDMSEAPFKRIVFNNCNLSKVKLPNTTIFDFNCTDSNLNGINFHGSFMSSDLSGSTLRKAHLRKTKFTNVDLSNCDFRDAQLSGVAFIHVDVDGADMRGAKLLAARLKDQDFSNVQLDNADMRLIALDRVALDPAKMKGTLICGMSHGKGLVIDAVDYDSIEDLARRYQRFKESLTSENSRLKSYFNYGAIENKDFHGEDLSDLWISELYLPKGTSFVGAKLRNLGIYETIIYAGDFRYADLSGAMLRNAILDRSDLREAKLDRIRFERQVSLQGVNLDGMDLSRFSVDDWDRLNIAGASFVAANLENAVFKFANNLMIPNRIRPDYCEKVDFPSRQQYPDTNFRRANLKGSKFIFPEDKPLKMAMFDFSGADMSNSTMENIEVSAGNFFIATNFTNANLRNFVHIEPMELHVGEEHFPSSGSLFMLADFTNATFQNADFSHIPAMHIQGLSEPEIQGRFTAENILLRDPYLAVFPRLNFSGLDLRALDLSTYQIVLMYRCNFEGANLQGVNLSNACLNNCSLKLADLRGTNMLESLPNFVGFPEEANSYFYVRGARMDEADYDRVKPTIWGDSGLDNVNYDIDTVRATLVGLDLSNRDMNFMCALRGKDMRDVNLSKSNLSILDFGEAMLDRANLNGADLSKVYLEKAHVDGVTIYKAKNVHPIIKSQLEGGETAQLERDRRMGY